MSRERKIFVLLRRNWKFSVGPTSSKPGPILNKVACTQEKTPAKERLGSFAETKSIARS